MLLLIKALLMFTEDYLYVSLHRKCLKKSRIKIQNSGATYVHWQQNKGIFKVHSSDNLFHRWSVSFWKKAISNRQNTRLKKVSRINQNQSMYKKQVTAEPCFKWIEHCLVIERGRDLRPVYLGQKMKSHVTIPMAFFPIMSLHTNCRTLRKVKTPGLCEHMAESISCGTGTA